MGGGRGGGGLMAKRKNRKGSAVSDEVTTDTSEFERPDDYTPDGDDWMGGQPTKKAKHFWPSAKRLFGLLAPEKWLFAFITLLNVVSVVLMVIAPKVLGEAMDVIFNGLIGKQLPAGVPLDELVAGLRAQGNDQYADMLEGSKIVPGEGIDFGRLGTLILTVIALYLVASFLMWLTGYLLNGMVMRVIFTLRQNIEEKINRLPLSYFDGRQRGDVLSRVTNDVDNIQQALQQAFSQLVQSVLTVIGITIMMFWVSWQLALIALIALPLSGVIAGVV